MTRNRFNKAKHQWRRMTGGPSGNPLLGSTSTNNLTLNKARGLFLENNDNIDMKDTYKITNVHPPIDEKDVVKKAYCDNNLLSSNNKIDILSKNISELRKAETTKFKVGDYVRNADKRNIFSKGYTSNWNRELFKVNEVLKTQPPTYKREDTKDEIIEGKYYEQELLKSEFDFESNNKVLESINIVLNINNDKKQIQ